ncbi:alpha-hydroxy-acid oxidizing protein [Nocardia sp. NPDC056100]|uniref:alpha-hydroxy acid oxidase n=1 Tax=Nocardia sp. NPDC056100 TaxID=3345712 RepID=UPI0035D93133
MSALTSTSAPTATGTLLHGRQLPRWSELRPLMRRRPFIADPTDRRLARAHTIEDLRAIARRRTPRSVFDYVDGAAEGEVSIGAARQAFRDSTFHPRILRDVSSATPETTVLGAHSALPLVLAPTGFTRLMHHEGELAVASAAAAAGIPYTLSTMGTTSIEELAQLHLPGARNWFQLYLWKDRDASLGLIERARAAGFDALVLTVDTPVAGARMRDVRNGFTIPPTLTARTVADISLHPAWWFNLLTTRPLEFASLSSWGGTVGELVNHMFDPSVGPQDLAWLRSQWKGKLIVKGIQSVADARVVTDLGADAIVLSNHGGRQLDRAVTPLRLLPDVVATVGDRTEIIIDTGIMNGADLVMAVALGASAGMVGRAYLYGLMAGGSRGVARALTILETQATRTMQLLGVERLSELTPAHVRLRE